ncbi:MAG TPA: sulfate adenylyltransferase subunit CysN [Bryobacteraceae bacterium]|nr:sulfate adenylyltransferase subunit CysN [Bryobacteraceae bacterium]
MTAPCLETEAADWLAATSQTDLLRFTTAGSVDDGKSTLIGRLLYDSKGVYEDQLASVRKATRNLTTGGLDLSLLTDGLRAEREQGITIDVAYRYFSTPKRKFIIADTPGHEQYTRNMATGASTADLAIILIDARLGILPQSRRHAYIAALLGIPNLVVAVNKMDLVDFREEIFAGIHSEFTQFLHRFHVPQVEFIPISALDGDNVVRRSSRTPWYTGPSLLEHLESVPISVNGNVRDFRFPVQSVIRPNLDFRGFAGQIASGSVRPGDPIAVLPSGRVTRVKSIVTWDGDLPEASAPMSVTVCLEDEVDVSRGDMLVPVANRPHADNRLDVMVVWMNEAPLVPHRPYLLKHTTQTVQARVRQVVHRVNINTMAEESASRLQLNEIGLVSIQANRALFYDVYSKNRVTGALILIDPVTNETVGAGMIVRPGTGRAHGAVTLAERRARIGHSGQVIRIRSADLASAEFVERHLFDLGYLVHVIAEPAHLAQAVRTAVDVGVIAILYGPEAEKALPADIPQTTVDLAEFESEAELARAIANRIDHLDSDPNSLNTGEGI